MDQKKIEIALKKARNDALHGPRKLRTGSFAVNRYLKNLLVLEALPPVGKTDKQISKPLFSLPRHGKKEHQS